MEFYAYVKTVVETTSCPVHQQSPIVNTTDSKVTICCCCIEFKLECYKIVGQLFKTRTNNNLTVAWRNPKKVWN